MRSTEPFESFAPWEACLNLVKDIYTLTQIFPDDEKNGLVLRLRMAAIDISVTLSRFITNRYADDSRQGMMQSLSQLAEIEALLRISNYLHYIKNSDLDLFLEKTDHMKQHVNVLIRRIQRDMEKEENNSQ